MNFRTVRTMAIAALTAGALLLSGCDTSTNGQGDGAQKTFASIDMSTAEVSLPALAEKLLAGASFDDANLIQMDDEIARSLYNISSLAEELVSYGSTGATAEAVLVVRCASEENAQAARDKIEKYRTEMADIYAAYNEPESGKLKNALLTADGVYVVYCVSKDSAAAKNVYQDFVVAAVYGEIE